MSDSVTTGRLGSPIRAESGAGSNRDGDVVSLEEHDSSHPIELGQRDITFLESLDDLGQTTPLDTSFTSDGLVIIETGSHVGTITLPSGLQIEVTPKQTVTRLLWALQYAFDTPVETFDFETSFTSASSFFDALGVLFQAELQTVLDHGLHRDYTRRREIRNHVQGRIDVQRQLQRPTAVTTDFAVEYDEFTTDNLLNQTVLASLRILLLLVQNEKLSSRLKQQEQQLREFVSVEPVSMTDLRQIELSRLNDHYEALLELARLILAREFFEDVRAGERRSLALFVNMNDVFERIVERAFRAAAKNISNLQVEGQASIPNLVEGPHAVTMRPDVLVTRDDGTPVTVADAKWKTGSTSSGDVYQLTSYILALEAPGAIVYPQTGGERKESSVMGTYPLRSIELATNPDVDTYDDYVTALEESARQYLNAIEGASESVHDRTEYA
ncbi:McrC family protein [Salinirubrum litoreum]|uniref:McrC family protein n=1 Tax=Salinirubrum litoreum TaxID=1126234 RepID=A0ABD5RB78_9EURY|nr:McrC family protein [Salinirubrum litoreum]